MYGPCARCQPIQRCLPTHIYAIIIQAGCVKVHGVADPHSFFRLDPLGPDPWLSSVEHRKLTYDPAGSRSAFVVSSLS